MDNFQDDSLSAPSDFTENMTMYMAEDFDISRWRNERASTKQKNKKEVNPTGVDAESRLTDGITASRGIPKVKVSSNRISSKKSQPPPPPPPPPQVELPPSPRSTASSSRSSSPFATNHSISLPAFAWPTTGEPTSDEQIQLKSKQEPKQEQQKSFQIQDLKSQLQQAQSENHILQQNNLVLQQNNSLLTQNNATLQQENTNFRTEISDLRTQFAEMAEQLAEFQIEYDALQKERHTFAKVLMKEWGGKEVGLVNRTKDGKGNGEKGVGFRYS